MAQVVMMTGAAAEALTPGYMRLNWIRMYDPYEGWPNGGPEFHATFTYYNAETEQTAQKLGLRLEDEFNISREDCDGDQIPLNKVLFYWDTEDHPTYSIQWLEYDGGDYQNLPVNDVEFELPWWADAAVAIVDYVLNIQSGDDVLEQAEVDADVPDPKYLGTGAPDFEIEVID